MANGEDIQYESHEAEVMAGSEETRDEKLARLRATMESHLAEVLEQSAQLRQKIQKEYGVDIDT